MRQLLEKRLLLVTGKGGVGKTTAAAALALAGRACGKRVLLAEINEQVMPKVSPLAALFGREQLPSDPARIDPGGLRGTLIRNEEGTELFLASVLKVKAMAKVAVRLKALRGLMHAGPSFYEMGIYYHLLHLI
ncbi:MAG: nucleotide-binding protein, partial [Planctomycetota bacterium]